MLLSLALLLVQVATPAPAHSTRSVTCTTPKDFAKRLQRLKDPTFKRDTPGLQNAWTRLDLAWPYEALAHAARFRTAVAALVKTYGLSAPSATNLLNGLLWLQPVFEDPWDPAPDALEHGVQCLVDAAAQAPGNQAPFATFLSLPSKSRVAKEGLLQALSGSPDPLKMGLRLLGASAFFWRLPLATHLASLHPETLRSILEVLGPAVRDPDWIPFLDAAQKALPLTATRDPLRQRTSELLLRALLEAQLPLEAARVYRSLPAWTRADLLAARWSTRTSYGTDPQVKLITPMDLRRALAGALLADQDVPAAREVFNAHAKTAAPVTEVIGRSDCEAPLESTVLEALLGAKKADPFTLFVRLKTCNLREPFRSLAQPLLSERYRQALHPPTVTVTHPGRDSIQVITEPPEDSPAFDVRFVHASAAAYEAATEREKKRVAQADAPAAAPAVPAPSASPASALIARQLASTLPAFFEERPASECATAQKRAVRTKPRSLPEGFEGVSAVKAAGGAVVLALSQRLDPVGEVSAGAYWLLGLNGPGTAPLYLGLREYRPYDLPADQTLPVVKDGRLYLLANVRELDEASLSFPPIELTTKRKKDRVCLTAKLSDLARDSDGDHLTDLVEARLLTDPRQKDSDGDGVDDAQDALPQVFSRKAQRPGAGVLGAFLVHLLWDAERMPAEIESVDKQGLSPGRTAPHLSDDEVTFLEATPESLIGVDLPFRVIPLTGPLLKKAQTRFGAFYPLRVTVVPNDAGDQAFIQWSEHWRGGAAKATRKGDHWEFVSVGEWIT